jgi:hypothetical protein
MQVGGTCPVAGDRLYCDDRTDCGASDLICCAADLPSGSSLADCRTLATCNGPKAQVLCDTQDPTSCTASGVGGTCSTMGSSTIDGYTHCN